MTELLISALCLALLVPIKEINTRFRSKLRTPIPGEIVVVRAPAWICPARILRCLPWPCTHSHVL